MVIDYDKVGLLAVRDRRILLCRKKHTTSLLILPGGCRGAGETALQCLTREIREELGDVKISGLQYLGTYRERAAGSDAKTVQIELYAGEIHGEPSPQAEIKELVWFGENGDRTLLSPSISNKILPDLQERGLLWPAT